MTHRRSAPGHGHDDGVGVAGGPSGLGPLHGASPGVPTHSTLGGHRGVRVPGLRAALRLGVLLLAAASPVTLLAQMATAERLEEPGWWPTKGTAARDEYVGPDACGPCHASRAASQQLTAMARTARRAESSPILREVMPLSVRLGAYSFSIVSAGSQPTYTANDGIRSLSVPLGWAFGVGKVGQTYLFERDGGLHEARVSYYDGPRALDVTPTRALAAPASLEEAMARPVPPAEARRCFGCHTTAPTTRGRFDVAALMPGVTCEACHGPGRRHVAAMERSRTEAPSATIVNPQDLDPADSVDFCGACHATFWDVRLADERGLAALRSQPYRLQSSKCWGEGDARLTCVACHDPHRPLEHRAQAYDARCLSCHGPGAARIAPARAAKPCPVKSAECVTCHMPKYEVPEMHARFTDHLIRVVRGGGRE
jgi:hypothetical protein